MRLTINRFHKFTSFEKPRNEDVPYISKANLHSQLKSTSYQKKSAQGKNNQTN